MKPNQELVSERPGYRKLPALQVLYIVAPISPVWMGCNLTFKNKLPFRRKYELLEKRRQLGFTWVSASSTRPLFGLLGLLSGTRVPFLIGGSLNLRGTGCSTLESWKPFQLQRALPTFTGHQFQTQF